MSPQQMRYKSIAICLLAMGTPQSVKGQRSLKWFLSTASVKKFCRRIVGLIPRNTPVPLGTTGNQVRVSTRWNPLIGATRQIM
jgi:hypothetical protein